MGKGPLRYRGRREGTGALTHRDKRLRLRADGWCRACQDGMPGAGPRSQTVDQETGCLHTGHSGGSPARPDRCGRLACEALALAVVIAGATALSRSCLLHGDNPHPPRPAAPALTSTAHPPRGSQPPRAGRDTQASPGNQDRYSERPWFNSMRAGFLVISWWGSSSAGISPDGNPDRARCRAASSVGSRSAGLLVRVAPPRSGVAASLTTPACGDGIGI